MERGARRTRRVRRAGARHRRNVRASPGAQPRHAARRRRRQTHRADRISDPPHADRRRPSVARAPGYGEHTDEVLAEAGYDAEQLAVAAHGGGDRVSQAEVAQARAHAPRTTRSAQTRERIIAAATEVFARSGISRREGRRHRRAGRYRLWPRVPLLSQQGGHPRRDLHRALGAVRHLPPRGRRHGASAFASRCAGSCISGSRCTAASRTS